jgi:hypothetical protein
VKSKKEHDSLRSIASNEAANIAGDLELDFTRQHYVEIDGGLYAFRYCGGWIFEKVEPIAVS